MAHSNLLAPTAIEKKAAQVWAALQSQAEKASGVVIRWFRLCRRVGQ